MKENFAAGAAYDSIVLDFDFDHQLQTQFIERIRKAREAKSARVIILRDFHQRSARIRSGHVITVDANPILRMRIVSAVAVAAGRASPDVRMDDDAGAVAAVVPPTVDEAIARGELILLAEDNATNRDVISRQLRLLGYACETFNDGRDALAAWKTGNYALILTDCHMPHMDGYELTASIRAAEESQKHIPIIAVTANALQGEAERCLSAGMDDYLSKPIAQKELRTILKKWMPNKHQGLVHESKNDRSNETVHTETSAPINERIIRDMFGDDDATIHEILDSFVETTPALIAEISAAVAPRNAEKIMFAAHSLKSAARTIGADALANSCVNLESAAKTNDWDVIEKLAIAASAQMAEITEYVMQHPLQGAKTKNTP